MATTVDSSRTRVTGVGAFDGNPVTITDSSITVPAGALLVAVVNAGEASTNAAALNSLTTTGLTWTTRATRGVTTNGGGANSPGFVTIATAPDASGGTRSVAAEVGWADNFVAFRASMKVYIVTDQHASPIGATGSGGPTQTPAAGAEYTPALLTATGDGRVFYGMTEQNGSSGSDGVSTSTDTEDAAYYATELVGVMSAVKASDHASGAGSIAGSIDPTAQTYVNWVALEVLAAAGGSPAPKRSLLLGVG